MKKITLIALLFVLVSCGGQQNSTEPRIERERLERELAQRDSLLNDVFASFNDISANLTEIKDREGIVTASVSPEIGKEQRAQIYEDIAAIDDLLRQNRLALERLRGTSEQLRRSNIQMRELETLIAGFARQIEDKDADIVLLREELESMQIRVAELNTAVDSLQTNVNLLGDDRGSLEAKLDLQDEMLHTVRYIVGSERSLRDEGVIKRSGGIFGGRMLKLNDGYDPAKFTPIDLRRLDRIVVGQPSAVLVTPHPADSYRWVEGANGIVQELAITDPERFWESSRVLVVAFR